MDEAALLGGDPGDEQVARGGNGSLLRQGAWWARLGGAVLIVCGGVGVVSWLWLSVQTQRIGPEAYFGGFGEVPEISLTDRVYLFVAGVPLLLFACTAVATGAAVRLFAAYMVVRSGAVADPDRRGTRVVGAEAAPAD